MARFKIPFISQPGLGVVDFLLTVTVLLLVDGVFRKLTGGHYIVVDKGLRLLITSVIGVGISYCIHLSLKRYKWFQKANSSDFIARRVTVILICVGAVWSVVAAAQKIAEYMR